MDLIQERLNITDLCNKLFIKIDEKNWHEVESCFADKVETDMTSMGAKEKIKLKPSDISKEWEIGLKDVEAVHHQVSNYQVEINGDEATFFCYGTAWHYWSTKKIKVKAYIGTYEFKLTKMNNQWKIYYFKFNLKFKD